MYNKLNARGPLAKHTLDLVRVQEISGYLNKLSRQENHYETTPYAGIDLVSDGDTGSPSSFALGPSKQSPQQVFLFFLPGLKRYPIRRSFGR